MRDVFLRLDDKDEGQWGVGIYYADDPEEAQGREYAPTEEAAFHNARLVAEAEGWNVVEEPE